MVSQPKIIAVASGKGGAGKTNVTLNLAWALSRLGHRVCILDADLGLSNVDVLLGIVPQRTLEQVLFERLPLELAITPVATGIDLVPGFSGVARMAESPAFTLRKWAHGGVRVDVSDDAVAIELYLIVEPGKNMLEISRSVQSQVTRAINDLIGMPVKEINVHILDVA